MSELNINRINIMMGSKCNFNCRHCIQTDAMNFENPNSIYEKVFMYIEHLANIRPGFKQKLLLMFWVVNRCSIWASLTNSCSV